MRRVLLGFWLLIACLADTYAEAADHLDLIRQRGEVIIGVKGDYVPFGMVDPTGALVGIEPDLAADLARRLGVGLQLVAVTAANRLQKLEEGSVDIIIATLGDTAERRSIATLIEPGYFASGANVMLRPDAGAIDRWADLTGQPVCATQGALFNAEIASRYLVDLQTFGSNRDAASRCAVGAAWAGSTTTLPSTISSPSRIGRDIECRCPRRWRPHGRSRLRGEMADRAWSAWSRIRWPNGIAPVCLIETVQRWGVPADGFLTGMRSLWTEN